jgi:hypothetical protein
MHCSVNGVLAAFAPNHFHDVELACFRPADLSKVRAERPKGGPDTLTLWKGSTDINPTIGKLNLPSVFIRVEV